MDALPTIVVEKPWGVSVLPAPFARSVDTPVGEIWFEPAAALPDLLVKYLFTSEKLSVQVHPNDEQARASGDGSRGKEESWYVIDAAPGAAIGIGFDRRVSEEEVRAGIVDGSIEGLLRWRAVKPGDFFYIPAGTVHAIGGGIALIEVQQNCDLTYRLFDYGRPRPLAVESALSVAVRDIYPAANYQHIAPSGEVLLVDGPYFRLLRYDGPLSQEAAARFGGGAVQLIPIAGVATADGQPIAPGESVVMPSVTQLSVLSAGRGLIAQSLG